MAVFDMVAEGGLVLCQPAFSALMDHYELGEVDHGPQKVFFHAELRRVDDIPRDEAPPVGRCRCGTWVYTPEDLQKGLTRPHGVDDKGGAFIYARYTVNPRKSHGDVNGNDRI
ncbi:MAG: hypothetical protein H0V07_07690 [Propionibacteriales bacterium]|nr:hypothetical protein [Propionibacteriales bacterium]